MVDGVSGGCVSIPDGPPINAHPQYFSGEVASAHVFVSRCFTVCFGVRNVLSLYMTQLVR